MASKTYIQDTITGSVPMRRTTPQGRRALPPELRRSCRMIASTTEVMRARLDSVLTLGVLSESDVLNHGLLMWLEKYAIDCTVNCSNTS